jgi:transcriptional regulator with XRE-family HTH domain
VSDLPDLDLLVLPGMPEALASREIATVRYRLLSKHGVPQRQIAAATGQSQSEVCEILKGRQVQAYDVLVRICEGLGVPREVMGLGFGAYAVDSPARQPDGEDEADVLRRQFAHLLALAGAAVVGTPIPGVGELLANPRMPDQVSDVPSRVGRADVEVFVISPGPWRMPRGAWEAKRGQRPRWPGGQISCCWHALQTQHVRLCYLHSPICT